MATIELAQMYNFENGQIFEDKNRDFLEDIQNDLYDKRVV